MQKITPHFWFDNQAEEAAKYYVELFENSKINNTAYYPEAAEQVAGKPAGSVMSVDFELNGQQFIALNGGKVPGFELNGAVSFMIACRDQAEIDHFWEKLSAVPEAEQCGWCTDKFGVTWQVVPSRLQELLADPDQAKVEKVTACFLKMKKFDIAELEAAAASY